MRRVPALRALVAALLAGALVAGCGADPVRVVAAPSPAAPAAPASPSATESASPSASPPAAAPARLAWKGCGDGFSCATLTVPLDPARPAGPTIGLAVTRHPATGPGARIGSLLVNPGGPGASAVQYLKAAWSGLPAPVRARFDVVAFDPPGVGASDPVRCATTAQLDAYVHLDPSPDDPAELAAYVRANTALAQGCAARSGAVLPYVSTPVVADDMDRLRAALGDARLTYLGYSYGTSIGAQYLERYPTHVRAMVLDGAIDPALTWDQFLAGQAAGFEGALQAFLDDCARTRCPLARAAGGDPGAALDRLAAQVEKRPLPGDGTRVLGPGEFGFGVLYGLYDRQYGWPDAAEALARAVRGDGSALLQLSDAYLERGPSGYTNVTDANIAVSCVDRPWPRTTAPYTALAARLARSAPRFGATIALSGLGCRDWPVPPVSTPHAIAAPGSPPVLVIGTTRDPATPYAWAVALARQLSKGVLLTHRGDGHTVYRAGAPACVTGPVDAYLITSRAPRPSTC